jgi:hypothetical protein
VVIIDTVAGSAVSKRALEAQLMMDLCMMVLTTGTTGKPEFAVRKNLCPAFSFGRTAKGIFAVRLFHSARQKKRSHGKKTFGKKFFAVRFYISAQ